MSRAEISQIARAQQLLQSRLWRQSESRNQPVLDRFILISGRWVRDEVRHMTNNALVYFGDYVPEFRVVFGDLRQIELCFCLSESHMWIVFPKVRQFYGNSSIRGCRCGDVRITEHSEVM